MSEATTSIHLTVNGQTQTVPAGLSISALLERLGFGGIPMLVERNGHALFPREFPGTIAEHGDSLELVRIVAGG